MASNRISSLKVSIPKEEENLIELASLSLKDIALKPKQQQKELIALMADMSHLALIKLCQDNSKFQIFCLTNPDFIEVIKNKLKSSKNIYQEICALDHSEVISIFEIYLAASYMSSFAKRLPQERAERLSDLTNACQLGLYSALLHRCEVNLKLINSANSNLEEAITKLKTDCERLANLYGAIGYIRAGCYLNSIGIVLRKNEDEEEKARGLSFIEEAVKCFLCASILKDDQYSNNMIDVITDGKDLKHLLADNEIKFSNWDDAHATLKSWIPDSFVVIEKRAQEEIANKKKMSTAGEAKQAKLSEANQMYANAKKPVKAGADHDKDSKKNFNSNKHS